MEIRIQLTLFFALFVFCQPVESAERSEASVIVEGLGTTVNEAAQNAAVNALRQVVGSFIDTETMLLKKTEIAGSIRSESKQITTTTKEYSQGSIKLFEILTTETDNGLIRVTAKVLVRIEEFKAFIRKAAFSAVDVDESLFAQIATSEKQTGNAESIIIDTILMPLLRGEATQFKIGKPVAAESARSSTDEILDFAMRVFDGKPDPRRDLAVDTTDLRQLRNGKDGVTFVIPVDISLDQDFVKNAELKLEAVAKSKRNGELQKIGKLSCPESYEYSGQYGEPVPTIAVKRSAESNVVECFSLNQVIKICDRDNNGIRNFKQGLFQALCSDTDGWMYRYVSTLPNLKLTLKNKNGEKLFEYLIPQSRRRLDQWSLTAHNDFLLLGSSLPIAAESRNSAGANTPLILPIYNRKIFLGFFLSARELQDVRNIEIGYDAAN